MSGLIIKNSLLMKVTINNFLTFSFPLEFQIDYIYINEQAANKEIEVNSTFVKPVARKFSNYKSIEGHFSFDYPSSFDLNQKSFSGSDILYHIDFQNKSLNVHGFVQVWNLPFALEEFLKKSKENSTQSYKYFSEKAISVHDLPGFFWDYAVLGNDNKYYKGQEVFLKKGSNMYRIAYFTPESEWSKSHSDIFWGMVNSFKSY